MPEQGTAALVDQIARGGVVVALLWIIVGGYWEWWFYGPAVRRREAQLIEAKTECEARSREAIAKLEKRCETYERMAVSLLDTTGRLVGSAERSLRE